jgi:hypothetical protein
MKPWETRIRKEIARQEITACIAAEILATEHGTKHEAGDRADLCPKCAKEAEK